MVNKDYKEPFAFLWRLFDALRNVMYVRNIPYAVTRLVFLKYILDNYIGATSLETMMAYADAQKMLALKDTDKGIDSIYPIMRSLDEAYGLKSVLASEENMAEYGIALFGGDYGSKKKNLTDENYKSVIDALSQVDLNVNDPYGLGKSLADALINMITDYSSRDSFRAEVATNKKLNIIAQNILDVKDTDVFCDFASGIGISTIEIVGNTNAKTKLSEINESVAALSVMLMIMYGYSDFSVNCIDSLRVAEGSMHGNKIFVDPPIGLKVREKHDSVYTDSTLIAIDMTINRYLDKGGIAVIPIPARVLFGRDSQTLDVRRQLVDRGILRAVAALPPMWQGMGINTNLLVIDNNHSDEIVFINAYKNKAKDLSANDVSDIIKAIKERKATEGFSYVASNKEVIEQEYELLPARYVQETEEEGDAMTLDEIESELSRLYEKLMKSI